MDHIFIIHVLYLLAVKAVLHLVASETKVSYKKKRKMLFKARVTCVYNTGRLYKVEMYNK